MAEVFLRAYGGDRFEAYSAGFHPRDIDPLAIEVMEERGFDMSGQHAKGLDQYLGKVHFGFVITLCDRAEQECPKTFPGMGTRLFWPFEDPVGSRGTEAERLEKFREVRDAIEACVQEWLETH
jgi:arsenate reductase